MDRGVDKWVDRGVDKWVDRGVDKWVDRGVDKWVDRGVDKWVDRGVDKWVDRGVDKWVDRGVDKWVDRGVDKCVDRGVDKWVDRVDKWVDRGVDKWVDRVDKRVDSGVDKWMENELKHDSPQHQHNLLFVVSLLLISAQNDRNIALPSLGTTCNASSVRDSQPERYGCFYVMTDPGSWVQHSDSAGGWVRLQFNTTFTVTAVEITSLFDRLQQCSIYELEFSTAKFLVRCVL